MAHQAVFAGGEDVLVVLQITEITQQIDALYVIDVQRVVEWATVYAHATARAGAQLELGIAGHLHTVAQPQLAEVDEEHFGEDVHVAGERQHQEEYTEGDGVERPKGQLEEVGHGTAEEVAEGLREEASVGVEPCGDGFAEQTQREDGPQRDLHGGVHHGVLGGALHAEEAGVDFLHEGEEDARQYVEQDEVHELGEEHLGAVGGHVLVEEAVEDGAPEVERPFDADAALDGAHHDEQEPAEGDAAVHVAQPPVLLADAQVQEALAEHLPDGRQDLRGEDAFPDQGLLLAVELLDPADVFVAADDKETDGP